MFNVKDKKKHGQMSNCLQYADELNKNKVVTSVGGQNRIVVNVIDAIKLKILFFSIATFFLLLLIKLVKGTMYASMCKYFHGTWKSHCL